MRLDKLTIENFMLIREAELTFPKHQKVIGIVGNYVDGSNRSNRAGKSTVIDAINYNLYGQSRVGARGHTKLINRAAQAAGQGFSIKADWVLDSGETLRVVRSRGSKGEPTVVVSGHEGAGANEVDSILSNILGFNYDEWRNTAYFSQGDIHKFMESSPKDKKDLLLTWLKQDRWEKRRLFSSAKSKEVGAELSAQRIALDSIPDISGNVDDISSIIGKNNTEISESNTLINFYNNEICKLKDLLGRSQKAQVAKIERKNLSEKIERLESELDSAIENKSKYQDLVKKIDTLENKRKNLIEKIDSDIRKEEVGRESREKKLAEIKNTRLTEILEDDSNERESTISEYNDKFSIINTAIVGTKKDISSITQRIKNVEQSNGVCPVLGETCGRVSTDSILSVRAELEEATKSLSLFEIEQQNKKNELNNVLADLDKKKVNSVNYVNDEYRKGLEELAISYGTSLAKLEGERRKKFSEYGEKIKTLKVELHNTPSVDIEALETELDNLETEYSKYVEVAGESSLKDPSIYQTEIDSYKDLLLQKSILVTKLTEMNESLNRDLENIKRNIDKRSNLVLSVEKNNKIYSAWEYCNYMFGPRGIPNEYIKSAFGALEEDINYLLTRLNSGLSVEFKPYKEGSTFEKTCLVCGTEFTARQKKCSNCGSTKEKKRIDQLVLNIIDGLERQTSEFDLDSGGGKTLISFAVRLALLFLKIREGNCQVPLLVLDEIAGMLDPVNRGAIMNIVLNVLTNEYNVEQIFWISHSEHDNAHIENPLVVTRYDDYSVVDWS